MEEKTYRRYYSNDHSFFYLFDVAGEAVSKAKKSEIVVYNPFTKNTTHRFFTTDLANFHTIMEGNDTYGKISVFLIII